jgi:hypothetical protein
MHSMNNIKHVLLCYKKQRVNQLDCVAGSAPFHNKKKFTMVCGMGMSHTFSLWAKGLTFMQFSINGGQPNPKIIPTICSYNIVYKQTHNVEDTIKPLSMGSWNIMEITFQIYAKFNIWDASGECKQHGGYVRFIFCL